MIFKEQEWKEDEKGIKMCYLQVPTVNKECKHVLHPYTNQLNELKQIESCVCLVLGTTEEKLTICLPLFLSFFLSLLFVSLSRTHTNIQHAHTMLQYLNNKSLRQRNVKEASSHTQIKNTVFTMKEFIFLPSLPSSITF